MFVSDGRDDGKNWREWIFQSGLGSPASAISPPVTLIAICGYPVWIDRLSLEDVRRVCENVPVRSVNLGTGENGLHPEFPRDPAVPCRDRGTTIALTSGNGLLGWRC